MAYVDKTLTENENIISSSKFSLVVFSIPNDINYYHFNRFYIFIFE